MENGLSAVRNTRKKLSNWTEFLFGGQLHEEILIEFTLKNFEVILREGCMTSMENVISHIKTQLVPRSKHSPALLLKNQSIPYRTRAIVC